MNVSTVLFATDGSAASECALEFIAKVLEGTDALLVLFHARHEALDPVHVNAGAESAQLMLERQIEKLRSLGVANCRAEWQPHFANPAQAIIRAAREHDADLIVMGTRGLGPWAEGALGSVSQRVLQYAGRPVLAVPATTRGAGNSAGRAVVGGVPD